ncbi:DUF3592 domain-containing protein [Phytohabitans aurantiacus]|jgi:hypothetical protein|uniref:DUF3592 domain-containing protein n=1 Tax=Phytohabitans aurantiacus TaxID=3016789 RepID=A0ABQ5QRU1_9ACTN|nr:DUF3592 domain-containing protein [Phytohabitans aurantiacus]GLH97203.1 hypothetical protein Pa4123_24780 [Phytohabitans aurantiacus]
MARKRGGPATPPQGRRIRLQVIAMGVVFLLGGLGLAVFSATYMWRLSDKAERLRAGGVAVTASVTNFYDGSGRGSSPDAITVTYNYEGKQYQARIKCGGGTGCHREPAPETTVWVDPAEPSEFVAANGNTSGSLSFFNSWTRIVAGSLFAVAGVALLVAILYGDRLLAWNRMRKTRG